MTYTHFDAIIIGDSIAPDFSRYSNVWETFFKESLNLGISGDRARHILWRVVRLPVSSHLKYVIIHCGTNSISKDSPSEIAHSILCIALLFKKRNPCLEIVITGIFPRDDKFSRFRIIAPQIKQLLKIFTSTYNFIDFLEPTKDWLKYNGDLNNKLFWTDHLHLSKFGNKKFASSIFTLLQQYKILPTYPKLVPAISVVCKSFILSQRVCDVDPPCYVTVDVFTVKNGKYSPLCYNVTSATHVKVCNFFVSCQMVCEVIPIHADVVHVTTNVTVKH